MREKGREGGLAIGRVGQARSGINRSRNKYIFANRNSLCTVIDASMYMP